MRPTWISSQAVSMAARGSGGFPWRTTPTCSATADRRDPVTLVSPPAAPAPPRSSSSVSRRSPGDAVRLLVSGLGQLLVTFAVIVGLLIGYEDFVSDLFSNRAQAHLREDLRNAWAAPESTTAV